MNPLLTHQRDNGVTSGKDVGIGSPIFKGTNKTDIVSSSTISLICIVSLSYPVFGLLPTGSGDVGNGVAVISVNTALAGDNIFANKRILFFVKTAEFPSI